MESVFLSKWWARSSERAIPFHLQLGASLSVGSLLYCWRGNSLIVRNLVIIRRYFLAIMSTLSMSCSFHERNEVLRDAYSSFECTISHSCKWWGVACCSRASHMAWSLRVLSCCRPQWVADCELWSSLLVNLPSRSDPFLGHMSCLSWCFHGPQWLKIMRATIVRELIHLLSGIAGFKSRWVHASAVGIQDVRCSCWFPWGI